MFDGKNLSLLAMAAFYMGAGCLHFIIPRFFSRIVPPYLPYPRLIVYLSGVVEIALGALLLVEGWRAWAARGIIILLIAIFPANVYHWQSHRRGDPPRWLLLLRLPLQGLLIWWAAMYV